jgi:hypothetical protein
MAQVQLPRRSSVRRPRREVDGDVVDNDMQRLSPRAAAEVDGTDTWGIDVRAQTWTGHGRCLIIRRVRAPSSWMSWRACVSRPAAGEGR